MMNSPEFNQETKKSSRQKPVFICEICNRTFTSSHNYNQHLTAHANNDRTSCPHCHKDFRSLKDHIKNVHNQRQFECGFDGCGKSFSKRHGLDRHLKTHSDDFKSIQCPECFKMFTEKIQLERHYLVHLKPEKQTNFQCHTCFKYLNRKADLIRHTRTVHKKKLFSCDLCPTRRFGTKFEVLKHLSVKHLGVKSKRRSPPQKMSINEIMNKHFRDNLEVAKEPAEMREFILNSIEPAEDKSGDAVEYSHDDLDSTLTYIEITEPEPKTVKWECQRCSRTFDDSHRLRLHNLRNHNWKCMKCSDNKNEVTTYHSREIFELHWITHHYYLDIPPDKIECVHCLDLFANIAAIHLHQKNEHSNW